MSARSAITKKLAEEVSSKLNGTGYYQTNLYGNCGNSSKLFEQIQDFPYVSITPGPEDRREEPSRQTFADLTVYFRVYVKSEEEAQEELEAIISDLETFIDTHQRIRYNYVIGEETLENETIQCNIAAIKTDEGLLAPYGAGEIAVNIQYEKTRLM